MRRSTQNLGLDSLPASILNRDNCKGFAPIGCLRYPPDKGYHFLTGVSFFNYFDNSNIHLTFGDKFESIVFLYALYEEGTAMPSQLLCLDETNFQYFGKNQGVGVPPSANEWVRFNTDEFLKDNQNINQDTIITDGASFKSSASRIVNYLVQKKNDSDFDELFRPPESSVILHDNIDSTQDEGLTAKSPALDDRSYSENEPSNDFGEQGKIKKKNKKTKQDIDRAYDSHVTPRKRTATQFYEPELELPKVSKKIFVNMNALEKELEENRGKGSKSKAKKAKKSTKEKKEPPKPKEKKDPKIYPSLKQTKPIFDPLPASKTPVIIAPSEQSYYSHKMKDEKQERDYLRQQSLLDLEIENKRTSSMFDMAERANRLA